MHINIYAIEIYLKSIYATSNLSYQRIYFTPYLQPENAVLKYELNWNC